MQGSGWKVRHTAGTLFEKELDVMQMNLWDDHDIWDGWGSYPPYLQNCPVFQGELSPR